VLGAAPALARQAVESTRVGEVMMDTPLVSCA